jgi:hypothetical protein
LLFLDRFRDYAFSHGLAWFDWQKKLGLASSTFYLITGCHKSSAWAVTASSKNSSTGAITMKLLVHEIGGYVHYSWENSGNSKFSNCGPPPRPKAECTNENHCIFIRGYTIAKKDIFFLLRKRHEIVVDGIEGSGSDIKSSVQELKKKRPRRPDGADPSDEEIKSPGGPPGGSGGSGGAGTGSSGRLGGSGGAGTSGSSGDVGGSGGSSGQKGSSGGGLDGTNGSAAGRRHVSRSDGPMDADSPISVKEIAGTSEVSLSIREFQRQLR